MASAKMRRVLNRDRLEADITAEAVRVFAESGYEGAEGKGESGQPRRIADTDADRDDGDEEKLARAPGEHELQEPGEETGAHKNDGSEEEHGDPDRAAEAGEKSSGRAELRENNEHRDDRQVLDNEQTDHHSARERLRDSGRGQHF